ncbi:MAG: transketolase [Bacteroidales bacterium]|nr:transketolase [Bacteroidales bacterium]MCF8328123.1 transketolase [Bacteroidales bacterium]
MQKTTDISELKSLAQNVRKSIVRSIAKAGSGHTGGSLGITDILTTLYFNILNHEPNKPDWPGRDRLILSIGHVAPALYATLAEAGYIPKEELQTLRQLGSRLQGHPGRDHGLPGLELSAGSLGQGLSVAVGMALSAKHKQEKWRVFSLHGDGELQEGSIWEAAMSAAHHNLDNLVALIDRNKVQIDGENKDVMNIEPLRDKWIAFGWEVFLCDGHDFNDILEAYEKAIAIKDKPSVIIASTKMGKGVQEIEDDYRWHGKAVPEDQLESFLKSLEDEL